ncbi:MAG: metallophosphoesterase family protein [Candidatus Lokiarchaeia archaeon]|nr:metallophosphoesterase family protein [Candidatus Lokiarchaeia archaeon]
MIENSFLLDLINNPQKISKLKFDIISKILKTVKELFEVENLLLELNVNNKTDVIYVIGDIHGNLKTLKELIKIINKNNPKIVIFLGDIVDRGPKQLECLIIIYALKILFPLKYYIIRGNHETLEINQYYGFFQDFLLRFKDQSKFIDIINVYNTLPLCILVNETTLCLHGGIPQDIEILGKLKGQKCKNFSQVFTPNAQSIYQIMWNDPKSDLQGFSDSFRGPGIKFFGHDAFKEFMKYNNLNFLIRAHECFPEGYRWFFNNRLLSIFSSANYRGDYSPNPASYAIIKNDEVIPKLLEL